MTLLNECADDCVSDSANQFKEIVLVAYGGTSLIFSATLRRKAQHTLLRTTYRSKENGSLQAVLCAW